MSKYIHEVSATNDNVWRDGSQCNVNQCLSRFAHRLLSQQGLIGFHVLVAVVSGNILMRENCFYSGDLFCPRHVNGNDFCT